MDGREKSPLSQDAKVESQDEEQDGMKTKSQSKATFRMWIPKKIEMVPEISRKRKGTLKVKDQMASRVEQRELPDQYSEHRLTLKCNFEKEEAKNTERM